MTPDGWRETQESCGFLRDCGTRR